MILLLSQKVLPWHTHMERKRMSTVNVWPSSNTPKWQENKQQHTKGTSAPTSQETPSAFRKKYYLVCMDNSTQQLWNMINYTYNSQSMLRFGKLIAAVLHVGCFNVLTPLHSCTAVNFLYVALVFLLRQTLTPFCKGLTQQPLFAMEPAKSQGRVWCHQSYCSVSNCCCASTHLKIYCMQSTSTCFNYDSKAKQ